MTQCVSREQQKQAVASSRSASCRARLGQSRHCSLQFVSCMSLHASTMGQQVASRVTTLREDHEHEDLCLLGMTLPACLPEQGEKAA